MRLIACLHFPAAVSVTAHVLTIQMSAASPSFASATPSERNRCPKVAVSEKFSLQPSVKYFAFLPVKTDVSPIGFILLLTMQS